MTESVSPTELASLPAEPLPPPSRYVVGIDLGTTNCALAYVDTRAQPWQVQTFLTPQLVAPGVCEPRETLPSFHYQFAEGEAPLSALRLPWEQTGKSGVVGFLARDQGLLAPGRLIASAKSWLCHAGVDRTAELLPWHGASDVAKLSPIEASSRYLAHYRAAWNHAFPRDPLEKQDLVLTLPASFDEVARELTVEAALRAGLSRVMLIEEPQAAFYAWIHRKSADWQSLVSPGQTILVCDVGGGTSDFTLIRARPSGEGSVFFHRVAVGEHLILGGDNMDLALAHHLEQKLGSEEKLPARQWDMLLRTARSVKETLLGDDPPECLSVHVGTGGARLLGGGRQVEVNRDEIRELLVEGFFPRVPLSARPQSRRSGFQEFGLPYAADPAITKNLAAFLTDHCLAGREPAESTGHDAHLLARPDHLLLNGGVFASPAFRQRLVEVLHDWFQSPSDRNWNVQVLDHDRLDLAVARGAAYYGMVRRGQGVRIKADLARTYYLGLEGRPPKAICLVPADAKGGDRIELADHRFELLVSRPVEFTLLASSTRLTDRPGQIVPAEPATMKTLPPIRTIFRARKKGEAERVTVKLETHLTEIGAIELFCREQSGERTWRLQFDIRSATQTDLAAHAGAGEQQGLVEETALAACEACLGAAFGPDGTLPPDQLVRRLTEAAALPRPEWPMSLLRRFWETLIVHIDGRRRSAVHEGRWLNLLGYSLRPGFGFAVDDWRVTETWRLLTGKLAFPTPANRAEWWILWRRIAGGLTATQQRALVEPLLGPIRACHRRLATGKAGGSDTSFGPQEWSEIWRLVGALELLGGSLRVELGRMLVDLAPKKQLAQQQPAILWAVGRLGSRMPTYGPLNTVVAAEEASGWIEKLLPHLPADSLAQLTIMQLARRTDDRHRDLSGGLRERCARWLEETQSPEHLIALVRECGVLQSEEQARILGDALPKGLRIL